MNQGWLFFYKMSLILLREHSELLDKVSQSERMHVYKKLNWDEIIRKSAEFYLNPEKMQEIMKSFDWKKKEFTKSFSKEYIKEIFDP